MPIKIKKQGRNASSSKTQLIKSDEELRRLAIEGQCHAEVYRSIKESSEEKLKNKFINHLNQKIEVPPGLPDELQTIKRDHMKKETRLRRIIYTCISAFVGFIILGVLYFSGRSW